MSCLATAQKEANIWYFGENAGLDFNSGSPVVLLDGALFTNEGCATISDPDGNLLFYTDGVTVYNRNHAVMLNGTGLAGSFTSTNSAIIVPKPGFANGYYIFTVDTPWNNDNTNGLQYSEVDMTLDNGLGGVTVKNILLETPVNEKVTTVKNSNSDGYWVISHKHNSDEFITYEVTTAGVNPIPIVTAIGSQTGYFNIGGQIKTSPDGSKLAVARLGEVQLFDFDNATGIMSNPQTLNSGSFTSYGIEFSSNGNLLYVAYYGGVSQYNLKAGTLADIIASEVVLISVSNEGFAALQIAPDGKIYVARQDKPYIDFIEYPNTISLGCTYHYEGLFLGGRKSRLGLPTFVQSFFNIGFYAEHMCFGEATQFNPNIPEDYDSLLWDFGDGNTSNVDNPTHTYASLGDYIVTLTVTAGVESSQEEKTITIFEQPIAFQPNDLELCDDDNDGFISFDLTLQKNGILNGQDPALFGISYYASLADYNNKVEISNPGQYINATAFTTQSIIASVKNVNHNQCETITPFNIQVFESPQPSTTVPNLSFCDNTSVGTDDDGIIIFDLTQNESIILNGQSSSNFQVNYFTDTGFNNQISNPASYQNTNLNETIYVQVSNKANPTCIANTQFEIEVYELPTVTPIVELKQCDDNLDGFSPFNLNEVISEITSNSANENVTFYVSQIDAINDNNPIIDVTTYNNQTVSTDVVWARVGNNNGCFRTSQINLIVTTTQIPDTFIRDFHVCDDNVDGVSQFDFSSVHSEIENMFPIGQQLTINYYRNEADALSELKAIVDISNYRNIGYPNAQQIYVRVDGQLDNDCLGLGAHINLYVEPIPVANPVSMGRQCDDDQDGMFPFDTSQIEADVLGGQSLTDVSISYFDENNNPLPSPLPNPFLTSSRLITIRITNNNILDGSCYDEITLEFIVDKAPIANPIMVPSECDDAPDDADGIYSFDTSNIEDDLLKGQTGFEVHYFDESGTELPSPLPNPFSTKSQTITVKVDNPINENCFDTTRFDFIVNPLPEFMVDTPQIVCSSDPTFTVTLDPLENNPSELYDYEWKYQDGTFLSNTPTLTVSNQGTYSITLTKTNGTGCSRTREIFVNASELATITQNDITVVDNSDNNTIRIGTFNLGQGDYEFALDNELGSYQDEPFFEHVSSGIHTLFIKDKKGCGISSLELSLIGYPKFFTPNGDGINDYWQVKGVNGQFQTNSNIFIFDRYGKLLKQLATTSKGWDGTFNGKKLPTDDYWFSVNLEDGREFKGHFTLKR